MMSNLNYLTILLIGFVDYIGLGLVYPVFAALLFDPDYAFVPEEATVSYRGALLGLLIGTTPFVQFLASPFLGTLSDRYGRKRILVVGAACGTFGYGLAIMGVFAHSVVLLFIYRALVGIAEGTVAVAQAVIADISSEENKARRFAQFSASAGIGFMIGPFLGGKLADPSVADWCGYSVPFIAASIMSGVSLLMAASFFSECSDRKRAENRSVAEGALSIRKVFFLPKLRGLFVAAFAVSFGWSFFNEFCPVLLRKKFDFTLGAIGNYYAYGGGWYALSAGALSVLFLKWLPMHTAVLCALMMAAVSMLSYLVMPDASYLWGVLPFMMFGLSVAFPTIGALISNHASKENQGEVLGVYQSVSACAMGISPLVLGAAVGAYPELTAWGGGAALFLAALAIGRSHWSEEQPVFDSL